MTYLLSYSLPPKNWDDFPDFPGLWAILPKNIDADCHRACDTFMKMSLDTLSICPCVNTFPYKKLTASPPQKKISPVKFFAGDTFLKMSWDLPIWPCVHTFQNPYKKLTPPPWKNFHPSNFSAVISRQPIALGSCNFMHISLLDFCISIFLRILNFLFLGSFGNFWIFHPSNLPLVYENSFSAWIQLTFGA